MIRKLKHHMSVVGFLSLGYVITIAIGTLLLMLPFATNAGQPHTHFIDALLTATSATCVTGLISFDTAIHWTLFGQIVILILIQIGGLGFMTIITLIFMAFKKKISLFQRVVLMQSAGSYNISEVVKLIKTILLGSLIFEGTGAILLSLCFCPTMGWKGLYYGVFHSISAFCNAGFDLMGTVTGEFTSLTGYYGHTGVNLIICALIIIGGSGFIVWSDILKKRFKFKNYELHTKIVLIFNTLLLFISTVLYFIFEFNNPATMGNFSIWDKILSSFFMAVTPRTCGFNTINLNALNETSKLVTMILMFIGGSSGSTAGGVKVTTMVVIFANLFAQTQANKKVLMFKRSIPASLISNASSLVLSYLILIFTCSLLICAIEPYGLADVLFEVISAIGTVGLGIGITSSTLVAGVTTTVFTKFILSFLMYSGRIGAFTLFSVLIKKKKDIILDSPEGKVLVG